MAAKLKSISKQIHWSSLLKAAVFGAAWLWLPYWAFILVAFYLYFIPWFQIGRLAVPFFALILLTYLQTQGIIYAMAFAAIFYAILLMKDLIIVDRRSAYEITVLAIIFFLLRGFYETFNQGIGGSSLLFAFLLSAIVAILLRSFFQAFSHEVGTWKGMRLERVSVWLSFLLSAQLTIAGLFLPLDFMYQSTIVFLAIVFIAEIFAEHLFSGLTRNKLLGVSSTIFALLVIILTSARWGL